MDYKKLVGYKKELDTSDILKDRKSISETKLDIYIKVGKLADIVVNSSLDQKDQLEILVGIWEVYFILGNQTERDITERLLEDHDNTFGGFDNSVTDLLVMIYETISEFTYDWNIYYYVELARILIEISDRLGITAEEVEKEYEGAY